MSNHKVESKAGLVTRRQVVTGLAVAGVASTLPSSRLFAADLNVDKFLKVSALLTGIALDKSYIQLGNTIWDQVTRDASPSVLRQWKDIINRLAYLPSGASSDDIKNTLRSVGPIATPMAMQLTKVWYTGRIERTSGVFEVINYDEALVWQACDFTKPPVTCGGPFGYWAKPYSKGAV